MHFEDMLSVFPEHSYQKRASSSPQEGDARATDESVSSFFFSEAIARIVYGDEPSQQQQSSIDQEFLKSLSPARPSFVRSFFLTLTPTIAGAQSLPRGLQHGTGRWLVRPMFYRECQSNNPKRKNQSRKLASPLSFNSLSPFSLSLSFSSRLSNPLSLSSHRAYVLFLTFAEVAKGGWTREVYKVNWLLFFLSSCLSKKNRRFFPFRFRFHFRPWEKKSTFSTLSFSLSLFLSVVSLRASLFEKIKIKNQAVDFPLKVVQTTAIVEIFHSIFGIVKSPFFTTCEFLPSSPRPVFVLLRGPSSFFFCFFFFFVPGATKKLSHTQLHETNP